MWLRSCDVMNGDEEVDGAKLYHLVLVEQYLSKCKRRQNSTSEIRSLISAKLNFLPLGLTIIGLIRELRMVLLTLVLLGV